ncbi:MAG: hypothetical protein SNG10_05330 [Rikenellaceae bacterium]
MTQEKSIFEIRRHPLLGAILLCILMSGLYVAYLIWGVRTPAENIVTPSPLSEWLWHWQKMHPVWSYIIIGCSTAFLGVKLGQLVSRYNLYGTTTHLPMELFPLLMFGVMVNISSLSSIVVVGLVIYSLSKFFGSYRAANCAGSLLSGTMALGGVALLYPPAVVLWSVVPFMVIFFDRTLREVIVTFFGLLVTPFLYIYVRWIMGGDFWDEIVSFMSLISTHNGYNIIDSFYGVSVVMLTLVLYMMINAVFAISLLENTVKAKHRIRLIVIYAIASIGMIMVPSADTSTFGIIAISAAVLIPVTLLKFGRLISFIMYLAILVCCALTLAGF